MWIPNIAALSAHYRTYALDSINDTGLSASRRSIRTPEHLVDWLDEVLAALVPKGSLSLVGMSYGGWLASLYALRFPTRLQKVVLLAPAATVLPVSWAFISRALLTLIPGADFRRKFYYWLLHDTVQSGETGRAWVDQAVADWAVAERCFGPLPAIAATVMTDNALQSLGVPVLFLVGENEKVYSAREAVKRLNRVAPHIKTDTIPNAGHDLWIAQADLVTRKILCFLGEPADGVRPRSTAILLTSQKNL